MEKVADDAIVFFFFINILDINVSVFLRLLFWFDNRNRCCCKVANGVFS